MSRFKIYSSPRTEANGSQRKKGSENLEEFIATVLVAVPAILLTLLGIVLIMEFFFWLDDRITFGPPEKDKSKKKKKDD